MNTAIRQIEHKFKGDNQGKLRAMFEIRNTIHQHMKTCADNVRVYIYVDEVLDEPLEFCVGRGENELIITVKHDGTVEYNWTYYT